jgi:hypothetical protein
MATLTPNRELRMAPGETVLIGVDGGATEVKAHAVLPPTSAGGAFTLQPERAARRYPRIDAFTPAPMQQQLAQCTTDPIEYAAGEREQGTTWIAATADVITEVARAAGATRVQVGLAMPGLKTPDGGGIAVMNNGPRIPHFLTTLANGLLHRGLALAAPLPPLQSDADCCGIGEEHAADGLFRDVANAYYVGGGTGVADALKLRGKLVPLDQTRNWLLKSWQIHSALGPTFEQLVSTRGLNALFARLTGGPDNAYPEDAAATGDPVAIACFETAALALAELVHERLTTIDSGRHAAAYRGPNYTALHTDHAYRGTVLERIVIGQRLGTLYADAALRPHFAERFERYLAALLHTTADEQLLTACLAAPSGNQPPGLRPGFVRSSQLRAAPALGAAVVAARAQADDPGSATQ